MNDTTMVKASAFDTSTSTEPTAENDDSADSAEFTEEMEAMETYGGLVETVRFCNNFTANNEISQSNDTDTSPVARVAVQMRDNKNEYKQAMSAERKGEDFDYSEAEMITEDDIPELNENQNLPQYKDDIGLNYEGTTISADNAEDFGLSPDQFEKGEEIFVPDYFEMPKDEDGNIKLWDELTEATPEGITDSMEKVKGVGSSISGKVLNQLQEDGYEVVVADNDE